MVSRNDCLLFVAEAQVQLPAGHYLNLPVVESDGRLVGIVDVLKLTYATLEQVGDLAIRANTDG
jgi:CBS domain-containing protein